MNHENTSKTKRLRFIFQSLTMLFCFYSSTIGFTLSFLYVCMVNTIYLLSFVETPRKFIIAELSIRKLGSSSVLIIHQSSIISTDKNPSLRIESSAIINLRGFTLFVETLPTCILSSILTYVATCTVPNSNHSACQGRMH